MAGVLGIAVRLAMRAPFDAGTIVGAFTLTVCALTAWLVRRGRVGAASTLFLSVSTVLVVGISIARGPDYPATIPLYLLMVLLAGLVSSSRAAIVVATVAASAFVATTIGHDDGLLPKPEPIGTAYRAVAGVCVIVVVTITALAALRRMRRALEELQTKNEELERTKRTLAVQVDERTARLAEALDAAQVASRTKTAFLANTSHELRTPMNAMLGSVDLLLARPLDDDARAHVRTIKEGGDALLAILNDVLDLSAVEAGRLTVERKAFDPRAVAHDVARLLAPDAQRAGLALDVDVAADAPPAVYGDERRVRQVVLNLAGNAVKFTEKGGVVVRVRGEHGVVRFDVKDTGAGVAHGDQERMFLPFTQLDSSSTRTKGGIGLGLAIARELAHALGGDIEVESAVGKGSTFTFTFPLERAPDIVRAPEPARGGPSELTPSRGTASLSILVAEDNEVNARVLVKMLAHLGLRADVVGTGAAALAASKKARYDCVLMDVHMPEMDGLEATRRIRAESERPPAVIAVTADALPEQHQALFAAGFDEVLTKPIFLDTLSGALLRAAERRAASRPR